MLSSRRSWSVATILLALAVVLTPALLLAHARLVKSTPPANERLTSPPTALNFWFSERPELRFTKIELLDSAGTRIPLGAIDSIAGDAMGVTVPIPGAVANGRYTIAWRTASHDGHPIAGKFSFVVDAQVPAANPPVADIGPPRPATNVSNAAVEQAGQTVFSASARWAELVAVLTLVGACVFALFVLPDAELPAESVAEAVDRTRRLANAVLALFVITTLWRLSAQADLILSPGMSRLTAMSSTVRDTGWGHAWLLGAVGAVVIAVGVSFSKRYSSGWMLAGLGVVTAILGESLTGHSGALSSRAALATGVDMAHVLGAGGWLGGLAVLLLAGLPATNRIGDAERNKAGHKLVNVYHKTAMQCVALLLISAVVAAWIRLSSPADLWTTAYGQLLLLKLAFVVGLLSFGWYHWRSAVMPAWNDDTGFRFKRSATAELLVGAAVLAATAVLVSTALPQS